MSDIRYRHELKYEINLSDYYSLRPALQTVAKRDPNAGSNGKYHIRSLYFDTNNDDALRAKINGLSNREKYRIRLYNMEHTLIRLEKKQKINGLCNKMSAVITRQQCESILSGDTEWVCDMGDAVLMEFHAKAKGQQLKPKTVIDYWREAYILPFGNVRITFDSDIRSGQYSINLFDAELPTLRVSEQGVILMEVKYDDFLPDVMRNIIQVKDRHVTAFSKYAIGRIYG